MLTRHLARWLVALGIAASGLFSLGAHAANIAFWSDEYPPSTVGFLSGTHTITAVTSANIDSGVLSSYDALLIGHLRPSGTISATTCGQIQTFLNAGKGLVSEWNGATILFPQTGSLYYPANMSCALFSGAITGGEPFAYDTPITITTPASPLVTGLSSPFSMSDGSEFVHQISGYGAEWEVAGTSDLGGTVYPTIMAAKYANKGCVALSPFDYFDALGASGTAQSNAETLLTNMVNSVLNPQAGCGVQAAPTATMPVPTLSETMLWLLSALILLAAVPALRNTRHH